MTRHADTSANTTEEKTITGKPSSRLDHAEQGIEQAVEAFRLAMIAPTRQAFDLLVSDTLSYGHSDGKIENKKQFADAFLSGASDFLSIDLSNQTIDIAGDTAIVRHTLAADTNDSGKPGHVNLKVLTVWQHTSGAWRLLARQAVKFAV